MLDLNDDIRSLSDFKRKTPDLLKQLKKTGRPVVLTMNGRAKVVIQDAQSYQRMAELIDRAEVIEGIRRGLDAVKAGDTMSLEDFDRSMRSKHKIPREG